ncbi:MAG: PEGA domain-containing protein [Deltaproteobacteria bacterium]|nr:PEGA domain-containing protein [Deltaproteobacteria bacterium]
MSNLSRYLLAAALPVLALGVLPTQAAKGPRKAQAFLIPFNSDSAAMTTRIGGLVEKSLKLEKDLEVVDLNEVLGAPPPTSLEAARKKAQELLGAGKQAYADVNFEKAEEKLKAAIEICRENAAWMPRIPEYTEALAYLAGSYVLEGETQEGQKILKELLLFKPDFRVDPEKLDPSLQNIVEQVRERIQSGSVGSISVYSNPPGARIFIDEKEMGFTPASLDRIPTGMHVLRLEALGTFPYGEVVEIIPTEDKVVRANLEPTEEYKKLAIVVREVGKEITAGKVGAGMHKLGSFVGLDWAFYGIVTQTYGEVTLELWIVSISGQTRIASRRTNFPDSEFALDKNVESFVKDLLKDARKRAVHVAESDDPLERRSGEDEWGEGAKKGKKKRTLDVSEADVTSGRGGSDDPLEGMDGMDDW